MVLVKIFGCNMMTYITNAYKKKFGAKEKEGAFIGYAIESERHFIYISITRVVPIYREVIFF